MASETAHLRNLLELAHRLDLEENSWFAALVAHLRTASENGDLGMGVVKVLPTIHDTHFDGSGAFDATTSWPNFKQWSADRWSPQGNLFMMSQGPSFWWSDASAQARERLPQDQEVNFGETLSILGLSDVRMCISLDPSGIGAIFTQGFRQSMGASKVPYTLGTTEILSHIAGAWRLRHLLSRGQGQLEAVLDPDGRRLQHAEGLALDADARESLRLATRSIDRARSRLALDPLNELLAQQVMVRGRWSLIDQFDADGKHMMFARVNDPVAPNTVLPMLSPRERQIALYVALGHSLKLISYELGLPKSTVSAALRRALKKLGLHGAAQLAEHVQTLVAKQFVSVP